MTRISAFMFCVGLLVGHPFAAAQIAPVPQPDPRYQAPRQYSQPLPQDFSRSQIYQNRKAQEAFGTPYGTINGKDYRPQPDEYHTRSRVLHPQAVQGWGYDPNAADYGPDYNAGILPTDYPVPVRGSNVTFHLPGHGYSSGYLGRPTTVYAPGGRYSTGGFSSYDHGHNSQCYLADSYWPNAADGAIVPAGADPYHNHFGPGFHRSAVSGHYRFPYYSYRRPWYYPGDASFQRNTQLPW